MNKRDALRGELEPLLCVALACAGPQALYARIAALSSLPGPRGNIELAQAFGLSCAQRGAAAWALCVAMSEMAEAEAPTNDPRELISFCGTLGLGMVSAHAPALLPEALARLRALAVDGRWRMREAVAMAIQALVAQHPEQTLSAVEAWLVPGEHLAARAVAAGLAQPAVLRQPHVAQQALALHGRIIDLLLVADNRRAADFCVLRQGLGYTISVVVAACPGEGLPWLVALARNADPDLRWIVGQNLRKKRLCVRFAEQVAQMQSILKRSTPAVVG